MDNTIHTKLTSFFSAYPRESFPKGHTLIWNDEDPPGVIFLESGAVGKYDIAKNGQKHMLNIFKSPSFFPMSWAINKTPNSYFYETLEPVKCHIAPPEDVVAYLLAHSDVTLDLLGRVYRGTDGLLKRLNESMSGSARSKLLIELAISAYRFGSHDRTGRYTLKIKTTELAERTGLSRETVSRELKKLSTDNLIHVQHGTIDIPDIAALENELRFSS